MQQKNRLRPFLAIRAYIQDDNEWRHVYSDAYDKFSDFFLEIEKYPNCYIERSVCFSNSSQKYIYENDIIGVWLDGGFTRDGKVVANYGPVGEGPRWRTETIKNDCEVETARWLTECYYYYQVHGHVIWSDDSYDAAAQIVLIDDEVTTSSDSTMGLYGYDGLRFSWTDSDIIGYLPAFQLDDFEESATK